MCIRDSLHTLLSDKHIVLDPGSNTIREVLSVLCRRAAECNPGQDATDLFRAVWAREQAMHTALPHGLAVPHARIDGLAKPQVLVARCREGVDFDAADGELSRLIFLILTPTDQPDTQIEMLALIAKTFDAPATRQRCLSAATPSELRAVLNQTVSEAGHDLTPHDDQTLGMA